MRGQSGLFFSLTFYLIFCPVLSENLHAEDLPPSMFGSMTDYPQPLFSTGEDSHFLTTQSDSMGQPNEPSTDKYDSERTPLLSDLSTESRGGRKFVMTSSFRTIGTEYFDIPFIDNDQFLLDSRLRLETLTRFDNHLSLQVTGDLSLFAGSLVRTSLWDQAVEQNDGNYLDLSGGFNYNSSLYFRQSLYRAYLTWETEKMRIDTGRKRVSWGVMRFWRPTDLFNPEMPLQIETGERPGVDCIHFKMPLSLGRTSAELVYAPFDDGHNSIAAKYSFISGTYDIEITGSSINDDDIYGLTFDGYIGNGGFRGEYTFTTEASGATYGTWAVGGDYAFPKDVTITIEYASNPKGQIIPARSRGLMGLDITWVADPLTTINLFTSFDDEGNSLALMPRYTHSLAQNDQISLGYMYTKGDPMTLYGATGKSAFIQFTRFF
jgi:hypothetical protein